MTATNDIVFDTPLIEGIIQKRKSMYTMLIEINGSLVTCHCPTTGRIGNLELNGRPCLLFNATNPKRKTPYTVEAVSLNRPDDNEKEWIGINQNAVNRYVEYYLGNSGFSEMVSNSG